MKNFDVRSPGAKVGGLVYFGRMLDKIRAHAKGELPADYQPNLGNGFDRTCLDLLQINYVELVERTKEGGTDGEILDWCFAQGRKPWKGKSTFGTSTCENGVGTMNSPRG